MRLPRVTGHGSILSPTGAGSIRRGSMAARAQPSPHPGSKHDYRWVFLTRIFPRDHGTWTPRDLKAKQAPARKASHGCKKTWSLGPTIPCCLLSHAHHAAVMVGWSRWKKLMVMPAAISSPVNSRRPNSMLLRTWSQQCQHTRIDHQWITDSTGQHSAARISLHHSWTMCTGARLHSQDWRRSSVLDSCNQRI